jgi:GTP-binding protein
VLVDSRHGLKDIDRDLMKMLDAAAVSYHLVLTKIDKIKATELEGFRLPPQRTLRSIPPPSGDHRHVQ